MRKLLLLCLCAFPCVAHAAPWEVDVPASTLGFEGTQSGEAFTGRFARFTPAIDFDPKAPEKGSIRVAIDMASVTMGERDQQDAVTGEDFFGVKAHPQAIYTSRRIRAEGDGFVAEGELALKGITRPVTLRFTLQQQEGATLATGDATLSRHDFGVGVGDYADESWIAYPVRVHFNLKARPAA
jgi:polyisoprenoid-binding protein YceI